MIDIDAATRHPDTELPNEDYIFLDREMDEAERSLRHSASRLGLSGIKIERWRRNYPELVMSWNSTDELSRNDRLLFQKVEPWQFTYFAEANAWKDISLADGSIERNWSNFPAGRGDANNDPKGRTKPNGASSAVKITGESPTVLALQALRLAMETDLASLIEKTIVE